MNAALHRDLSVLVIDDQRTMRLIVRQLLRQVGVSRAAEAADGREAIEKLAERQIETPDLVICDLHMEGMDGMAFTAAVRRGKTKLPTETPYSSTPSTSTASAGGKGSVPPGPSLNPGSTWVCADPATRPRPRSLFCAAARGRRSG